MIKVIREDTRTMKRKWIISSICLLITAAVTPCIAQASKAKNEIQSLYDTISSAYQRKDADAIMATRAEGYQELNKDGFVLTDGKDAEQQRLERLFSRSFSIDDKTIVESVTMAGPDAVVTYREDYIRTQTDPQRSLVGMRHISATGRDFWVRTGDTWQLKRTRTVRTTQSDTINGKPVH